MICSPPIVRKVVIKRTLLFYFADGLFLLLNAIDWFEPFPVASITEGLAPCATKQAFTGSALSFDKPKFKATEPVLIFIKNIGHL